MSLPERIQQLNSEISASLERALSEWRRQVSERLRSGSDEVLSKIEALTPHLPESFVAHEDLAPEAEELSSRARREAFAELRDALGAIDQARSQAGVLEALLEESAPFAARAAVLLLRSGQLRGFAGRGFDPPLGAERPVSELVLAPAPDSVWGRLSSSDDHPVACVALSAAECADISSRLEAPLPRSGVLLPLVLRDRVVAALYADSLDDAGPLMPALQALTYVAAQAIESLPFRQRASTATLAVEPAEPTAAIEPATTPAAAASQAAAPEQIAVPEPASEPSAAALEAAGQPAAPAHEASKALEAPEAPEEITELQPVPPLPAAPPAAPPSSTQEYERPDLAAAAQAAQQTAEIHLPARETPAAPVALPQIPRPPEPPAEARRPEGAGANDTVLLPRSTFKEATSAPWGRRQEQAAEEVAAPASAALRPAASPAAGAAGGAGLRPVPAAGPAGAGAGSPAAAPAPGFEPLRTGPILSGTPEVRPPSGVQGPGWAFSTTRVQAASSEEALHEEARRLARLLVSEIKLYNEEQVEAGRRNRDIYERLREDIDRSRQMYEERVEPKLAKSTDYFYQELVRILAAGDSKALGI
ncbi:MAG TPA: hypothetical protein VHR45_22720 [Thermoanaerobaculia bacterium]|nr:hypothetical protein [Thermoanaerobaculia bacterium]